VTGNPRFSSDPESGETRVHTPGGMADPAPEGRAAEVADIASTDMAATPSSRTEESQPVFGGGRPDGLAAELEATRERHLRLAAEFDNYKKRIARERTEQYERAQAALAGKLLDALDDLDRLDNDPNTPADALREGIGLIERKFRKELEAAGLERIDPEGQPFDPAVHEAVSVVPAPSADRDHTVSATFQTGYRFKGTLLRPARVQVFQSQG
jgi:molecular chaperone GrpE